jgi:hypothetical protein
LNSSKFEISYWGNRFIRVLGLLFSLTIPFWVISSYLGIIPIESVSFMMNDGWCKPEIYNDGGTRFFGGHCFGDYELPLWLLAQDNIWLNPLGVPHPYTPTGMIPHLAAEFLLKYFESRQFVLFLYLLSLVLAVLIPALFATKRIDSAWRPYIVTALSFSSMPLLIAVDRGNSSILLLPFMYFAVKAYLHNEHTLLAACIIMGSMLRPQFVFLVVFFLAMRKIKMGALVALASVCIQTLGFVFWKNGFDVSIKSWLHNLQVFSGYVGLGYDNASIATSQSIWRLTSSFGLVEWDESPYSSSLKYVGILFLLLVTFSIFLQKFRDSKGLVIIISLPLTLISPGISWAYYLFFAIVIGLFLIDAPTWGGSRGKKASLKIEKQETHGIFDREDASGISKRSKVFTIVVTSASLVPVPIPISETGYQSIWMLWQGTLWFLLVGFLVIENWVISAREYFFKTSKRHSTPRNESI